MSNAFRRFEILLPLRFNDGAVVPADLVGATLVELEQRFGAVSSETQTIRGTWRHEGQSYRDDLMRVFVDAPDTAESLVFIRAFKETLKERFKQIDIWVTSYPVDVI